MARVRVGRLPCQMGQGGGEGGDVLTGPGADFQHLPLFRQHPAQNVEYRLSVATGGWEIEAWVVGGRHHAPGFRTTIRAGQDKPVF